MNEALKERLLWLLTNPITAVTAIIGMMSQVFHLPLVDALWMTIWNNAGISFTLLSVIRSQVDGPLFGVIPVKVISALAAAVGMVFVLSLLNRLYGRFQSRYRNAKENDT
jgi:hypothetical protein